VKNVKQNYARANGNNLCPFLRPNEWLSMATAEFTTGASRRGLCCFEPQTMAGVLVVPFSIKTFEEGLENASISRISVRLYPERTIRTSA